MIFIKFVVSINYKIKYTFKIPRTRKLSVSNPATIDFINANTSFYS